MEQIIEAMAIEWQRADQLGLDGVVFILGRSYPATKPPAYSGS